MNNLSKNLTTLSIFSLVYGLFVLFSVAFGATSTIVYTRLDGYCGNNNASYSTAHDASSGLFCNANNSASHVTTDLNANYNINRVFQFYDLADAGIPSNASIISATSSFWNRGGYPDSVDGSGTIISNYAGTSTSTLSLSDYSKCDATSYGSKNYNTYTVGSVNQIPLNLSARNAIKTALSSGGLFQTCDRTLLDYNNVAPTGANTDSRYSIENGIDQAHNPRLLIEWEVIPVNPPASLAQFKSDATSTIPEGGTTTEDTVVFGATLNSSSTNQLRLEVEVATSSANFYVYNLFTKQKHLVVTTTNPAYYFKPLWISDTEPEYTLPSGGKRFIQSHGRFREGV